MTLYSKVNDLRLFVRNFLDAEDFRQWFSQWTTEHPKYHTWYISDTEIFIGTPDDVKYIFTATAEEIEMFFPRGIPDEP